MKEAQHQFLSLLGLPPARLTVEQVAWLLGCQPHDVPVLVSTKLLKPLGNPPQNGIKYFATAELVEQMKERNWLSRITMTIGQHWHRKNSACKRRVLQDVVIGSADVPDLGQAGND